MPKIISDILPPQHPKRPSAPRRQAARPLPASSPAPVSTPAPETHPGKNKIADLVKKVQQSRESQYEPYASTHSQFLPREHEGRTSLPETKKQSLITAKPSRDQESDFEEEVTPGAFMLQKKEQPRVTKPSPKEDSGPIPKKKGSKARRMLRNWGIAFILLLALAFGGLTYFSSADAIVVQKKETVTVDAAFSASPTASAVSSSTIPYQIMTVNEQDKQLVPAVSEKQIDTKASGTVTLFNAYATKPYRLVRNTRLQTPQGVAFKLADSVTLPGMKTVNGKTVPGSADVTVYAESSGTDYNVGFSDFSLPGFKGKLQYTSIYGRSKTSIGGGWSGTKKIASDSDVASAREKLRASLQQKALKDASANTPEAFLLPQNAYSITYESLPDENADTGVTIKEQATLRGIIFAKDKLSSAILQKATSAETRGSFAAVHPESLSFISANPDFTGQQAMTFSLKGNLDLVGTVDLVRLGRDLAGQQLSSLPGILSRYPGIDRIEAGIRPPWMRSFPKDAASISVSFK